MMMPPKKSKAARESGAIADSQQNGTSGKLEVEQEEVNVFKVEILLDKRQRNLPASEQNYKVWIAENFEETDSDVKLSLSDTYECYRSMCTQSSTPAFDTLTFYKMIRESFPKNFQLKEGSPYESSIKKKKPKKKSDKKSEPSDAIKVNLKEVLETTINEFGNPTRGIRFSALKTRVASKYPSLNLDQKPQFLMMVLARGIRNRFLECVRGVGRCGFYRMLGPPTPEEQEREEKLKKLKKEKGVKKEDQKEEGAGDAGTSGAEGDEENKEENKEEEKEGEEPEKEEKKPRGRGKSKAKGAAGKKPAGKGKKKKVPTATLR